jgi:hypothetical protein
MRLQKQLSKYSEKFCFRGQMICYSQAAMRTRGVAFFKSTAGAKSRTGACKMQAKTKEMAHWSNFCC